MKNASILTNITLLSVACLTIMVGCVIVPGLPGIALNLGVNRYAGWLVTLPALGVVIFAPAASKYIGKVGLYKALCTGLLFYGLLGAIGAIIYNPVLLFLDRLVLGAATALVMTTGTGLISELYSGDQRMKMIAIQGMSIELGGVLFLFIGGFLASLHWSYPFALYFFAWFLLILVWLFVPDIKGHPPCPTSSKNYQASGTAKITWFAALCSLIVFFTAIVSLPSYLGNMGLSESDTGLFLSFISLVAVGAAWIMPNVIRIASEQYTLYIAFIFYACGHGLFYFALNFHWMIAGAVCMGFGFGFSVPLVNHIIVEISAPEIRSKNLAVLSMAIFLGQFLSSFMTYLPIQQTILFAITSVLSLLISVTLFFCYTHDEKQRRYSL